MSVNGAVGVPPKSAMFFRINNFPPNSTWQPPLNKMKKTNFFWTESKIRELIIIHHLLNGNDCHQDEDGPVLEECVIKMCGHRSRVSRVPWLPLSPSSPSSLSSPWSASSSVMSCCEIIMGCKLFQSEFVFPFSTPFVNHLLNQKLEEPKFNETLAQLDQGLVLVQLCLNSSPCLKPWVSVKHLTVRENFRQKLCTTPGLTKSSLSPTSRLSSFS